MSVRIATPQDEDAVVDLLRIKHAEDGIAPFVETRVRMTVRRGLEPGEARMAIIGIIRGPRIVEASIGLYVSGWWYSDLTNITDLWSFVHPDYRKSTHAKTLIDFAKRTAVALDKKLMMHEVLNTHTANKAKLVERQLGSPGGLLFFFDPASPIPAKAAIAAA